MVDKMLLSYVNQMYILESELYSLCQIKSSLENERTVQMNRIQDEKFSYSLPRHSNTNIGEYVKGTLVLFLGILVVGGGYVQPEEMAKIVICITKISTFLILCDLAVCLATLYVSFSLVFALMRYLQGKVFLIRFYSPTTLSSSRAEFRLPSRLACA